MSDMMVLELEPVIGIVIASIFGAIFNSVRA